jgi:ubiquinone/menaquinone biosynthesis C-methylase UbiE
MIILPKKLGGKTYMGKIGTFTQPDTSPAYFIDFLEFLDNQPNIKSFRAEAAKRLNLAAGLQVLDLGCGIGGATFPIAEVTGPTGLAAGVDISSALIEVAKRRAGNRPGLEFRVGEAGAIPYPSACFDVARTERVFLYVPDRLAAIHEMKRVVKPGGRVCLIDTDLDCTAIYSKKPSLTRKLTSVVAASLPNPNSGRELPALARQAGLKNIQTETFAVPSAYEFLGRVMAGALAKAVEDGIVPRSEVDEWLAEQASLAASGDFFQIWFFVLVDATV